MTKKKTDTGWTHLTFVLDKSGSMAGLRTAVIDGFNRLIADQRKEEGRCTVSLVQFDHRYEEVYLDMPLEDVPLLTAQTYVPEGDTGLYDALGRVITSLGTRMDALAAENRPDKNMIIVHTDGHDTCSKERSAAEVRALVKEQQQEAHWLFIFSGANIDAAAAGAGVGVMRGSSAGFVGSARGVNALYGATSSAVMRGRKSDSEHYKAMSVGTESFFSSSEVSAMAAGDSSLLGTAGNVPAAGAILDQYGVLRGPSAAGMIAGMKASAKAKTPAVKSEPASRGRFKPKTSR